MASTSHSTLVQMLASSQASRPSFALRSLQRWVKRWAKGVLKQGAIALLTLTILLNLNPETPSLDTATAIAMASEHHEPSIGEPLASASTKSRQSNETVHSDQYFGLDAHLTHYRFTRARLSIPHPLDAHQAGMNASIKLAKVQ